MTLEAVFYVSQIVAGVAVTLSLIFVGLQVRQNTAALYRNEHNSTMAQWTVIRMAMVENRDIAELMTAGLHGTSELDDADQLRLEQFLHEQTWACFHVWDRTQRGVFPKGTFESTQGPLLEPLLTSKRGSAWWKKAKLVSFFPAYVADVEALLARPTP
ncbi:MAG TPA: hypothetical protein VIJ94_05790 [Caulobacteraceae bacterium]